MMESVHAAAAEIAHVLFIDVVDYSKQSTTEQSRVMASLNESVLACSAYRVAKERGRVLAIPTGDGMALLFFDDVLAPANCATVLKSDGLRVRMGIHSGLVQHQTDIAGAPNVVGEGINTAQRILDAGDEGHILVSAQYANWLKQFEPWQAKVHEAGKATTKHGEELSVYNLYADGYGNSAQPSRVHGAPPTGAQALKTKIVLLYRRNAHPDDEVLAMLEPALGNLGYEVFIDRHLKIGVEWAKAIEQKIRSADVVLALLSDSAMRSEMLEYEIETAFDENKKRGKPFLLPIRVGTDQVMDGAIGAYVNGLNFSVWRGPQDNQKVVTEIVSAITDPPRAKQDERQLEPVGGAVSPDSPFYIERDADPEFLAALKARESILLVKGPRQIGKTSLIARGIKA